MAKSFQRFFLLAAVLTVVASAAPFVPPGEANPPFRRDRIPLDGDAMVRLAKNLTTLTQGGPLETPEQRRAAAQALGLALALDPSNSAARSHISALENGGSLPNPEAEKLEKAKAAIWRTMPWFAAPEAGPDGNLLANLTGDVLSVLDREHPAADALRQNSVQGEWDGWIAPLTAFEDSPTEEILVDPFEAIPEKIERKGPSIVLRKAELSTVLYSYDRALRRWSPELTAVRMEASKSSPVPEDGGSGEFAIEIPGRSGEDYVIASKVARPIGDAMKAFLGALPERGTVSLLAGSDGIYQYRKNLSILTGPGFVLATAATSGNAPQGILIGELKDPNRMVLPKHFWRLLVALSKNENGGRLVLPAEAEDYLLNFLALENPDFFLNHEVLLATSPAQFVALSAGSPSEEHSAVFGKFAEIVEKSEGNPVGPYLANRFVRQRLQEIIDVAPYHLSAKLLARQGAGMRPRYLSKKVLAAEIWRSVDPVSELTEVDLFYPSSRQLERLDVLQDKIRTEVDALERYADTRDRELVDEGKDLAAAIKNFARKLKGRRGDFFEDRYAEVAKARGEMAIKNEALVKKLSEITGDPPPAAAGRAGP